MGTSSWQKTRGADIWPTKGCLPSVTFARSGLPGSTGDFDLIASPKDRLTSELHAAIRGPRDARKDARPGLLYQQWLGVLTQLVLAAG
jgi:hypothetical protein